MGDVKLEFGWSKLPGDLQKRWPRDDSGEFVAPKFLAWRQCVDLADEFLVNMLEAYGIPCIKRYPGNGSFGKLILGMSGEGTEIYVPKSMLEDAAALCSANASASADTET